MPDVKDLTLRDWFAGMAFQALLAKQRESMGSGSNPLKSDLPAEAYQWADALLRAKATGGRAAAGPRDGADRSGALLKARPTEGRPEAPTLALQP